MKSILLIAFSILVSSAIIAQKKLKKEVVFINPAPIENDVYSLSLFDGISDKDVCKFGAKIENKTEDYLLVEMSESNFKINDETFKHREKSLMIKPFESKRVTYTAESPNDPKKLHARSMDFEFKGMRRIPAKGKIHKAEDFKLPVAKNEIEFEDFQLSLKASSQETKLTSMSFELLYTGNDYAIVQPNKITGSIPAVGTDQFANVIKKGDKLLAKGDKMTLRVGFKIAATYADMQFATIMVHFNDAFQTSAPEEVEGGNASFELDPERTKGKH